MLQELEQLSADPILGLSAACRADPNPDNTRQPYGRIPEPKNLPPQKFHPRAGLQPPKIGFANLRSLPLEEWLSFLPMHPPAHTPHPPSDPLTLFSEIDWGSKHVIARRPPRALNPKQPSKPFLMPTRSSPPKKYPRSDLQK